MTTNGGLFTPTPEALGKVLRDISAGNVGAPTRTGKADVVRARLDQGIPLEEVLTRSLDDAVGVYALQMRAALKHPPASQWVLWGEIRYAGGHPQVVVMPMAREQALGSSAGTFRERLARPPAPEHMTAVLSLVDKHAVVRDLPLRLADEADELVKRSADRLANPGAQVRTSMTPEQAEVFVLAVAEAKVRKLVETCALRFSAGDGAFAPAAVVVRVDARDPGSAPKVDLCTRDEIRGDLAAAVDAELATGPVPDGALLRLLVTPYRKALGFTELPDPPEEAAEG